MAEKKEIAKVEVPKLPAIPDPAALKEIFEEYKGIHPTFSVLKVPSGGALFWTVPGDEDAHKELVGIILDHYPTRVKWQREYSESGGKDVPECSSINGIKGNRPREGEYYDDCATCGFAKFGTGKDGRGQACKYRYRTFLLLANRDEIFPYVLALPPTSAPEKGVGYPGSFPTYMTTLMSKLKKPFGVWSKVKLMEATAKTYEKQGKIIGGEKYSKAQWFHVADLNEQEKKFVAFLKQNLATAMREKGFEPEEYEDEENGGRSATREADRDPWDEGPPPAPEEGPAAEPRKREPEPWEK